MKIYSMLYGLTNKDFSVIGTLAGTAAKSALVSGMMYPMTEVAYGATDRVLNAVLPTGIKRPLPNGYKPQELKNDPLTSKPSANEERMVYFNNVCKYLDGINNKSELKEAISTIDPKYSFEVHHYLKSRGLNPSEYMRLKSGDKSIADMATKKDAKPDSNDSLKKAIPWALMGLFGTQMLSPTSTDPQIQYQNNQKAIRNGLMLGLGAYANKMGYLDDFKSSFGFNSNKKEDTPSNSSSTSNNKSSEPKEPKYTFDQWNKMYDQLSNKKSNEATGQAQSVQGTTPRRGRPPKAKDPNIVAAGSSENGN